MAQLTELRDFVEEGLDIQSGDPFIDSTYEDQLIQRALDKTADKYDWPELFQREAEPIIANVDRYDLPTRFRKFKFVYVRNVLYEPVDFEYIYHDRRKYSVDKGTSEYVLSEQPSSATDEFVTQDNESAGSSVTVALDTVDGLNAGAEIYVAGSTENEFTVIQSVDSDNTTIDIKLANNTTAGDKLYRVTDMVWYGYQKTHKTMSGDIDEPDLPDAAHLPAMYYAMYLYMLKQQDNGAATAFLQQWNDEVRDAWVSYRHTHSDPVQNFSVQH